MWLIVEIFMAGALLSIANDINEAKEICTAIDRDLPNCYTYYNQMK